MNFDMVIFLYEILNLDYLSEYDLSYSILIESKSLSSRPMFILGRQDPIDQYRHQTYSFSIIFKFWIQHFYLSFANVTEINTLNLFIIKHVSMKSLLYPIIFKFELFIFSKLFRYRFIREDNDSGFDLKCLFWMVSSSKVLFLCCVMYDRTSSGENLTPPKSKTFKLQFFKLLLFAYSSDINITFWFLFRNIFSPFSKFM
mgnify:FL=1